MKRITTLLTLGLIATLSISSTSAALATTSTTTPEDILRENTVVLIEVDPTEMNETIKDFYLEDTIKSWLEYNIFYNYWNYEYIETAEEATETQSLADKTKDYLYETISKSKFYLGAVIEGGEETGLSYTTTMAFVPMTESAFNSNVKPFLDSESETSKVSTYTIYSPATTNADFTYIDGYLMISEYYDALENVLKQYTNDCETEYLIALSQKTEFSKSKENFFQDSLLKFYLDIENFDEIADVYNELLFGSSFLSAIKTEGASIKETTNGFKINAYLTLDPQVMSNLGIDQSNPVPLSLYKYMPNENPIFFSNSPNNEASISMTQNMPEYDEFMAEFEEYLGTNPDNILSSLKNEVAYLVQDTGDLIPAITILSKPEDNISKIKSDISTITSSIWETLSDESIAIQEGNTLVFNEEGTIIKIKKEEIAIGSSKLTQFTLSVGLQERKNPYAPSLTEDQLTFKFTIGTTDENLFLFSTNKNIKNEYKQGLQNNSEISTLISKDKDQISYINVNNINSYIQNVLDIFQESISTNMIDLSSSKEFVDTLLSPWGIFTEYSSISNSYISSTIEIDVDFDEIITNYTKLFESTFDSEYEFDQYFDLLSDSDFYDVQEEDWYGDDVYYLNSKGIVSGYYDGNYLPENNINRAEFTKLIVEILKGKGYLKISYWHDEDVFSDIDYYAWYKDYVYTAYEYGIINGYSNGTFGPDQVISRAEAAQIITNTIEFFNLENQTSNKNLAIIFDDINGNEWYVDALKTVYDNEIMFGTSSNTFDPTKTLNRAESATLIRNLLEKL